MVLRLSCAPLLSDLNKLPLLTCNCHQTLEPQNKVALRGQHLSFTKSKHSCVHPGVCAPMNTGSLPATGQPLFPDEVGAVVLGHLSCETEETIKASAPAPLQDLTSSDTFQPCHCLHTIMLSGLGSVHPYWQSQLRCQRADGLIQCTRCSCTMCAITALYCVELW